MYTRLMALKGQQSARVSTFNSAFRAFPRAFRSCGGKPVINQRQQEKRERDGVVNRNSIF